jgi:predicted metalloprotease with PDZ domain
MRLSLSLLAFLFCQLTSLMSARGQTQLMVDASEVTHKILHVELTLPAVTGPMTLVYPKWIPGEHGPAGPIGDLTGVRFRADGHLIPWERDPVDMFAFHLQVPAGTSQIKAELVLVGTDNGRIFDLGYSTTSQLSVINWNQVILYPAYQSTDNIIVKASIRMPAAWKFGTALTVDEQRGGEVTFRPVTLTTLVDSPLIMGNHFREIVITPPGEERPHFLDIVADSEAALDISNNLIARYRQLVRESGALFHARHYDSYRFLVSLHGTREDGLEHHESSDDRLPEMALIDRDLQQLYGYLPAHEMFHSWNGKFRRPEGLVTADYQQPMRGDLLWVYEGLTSYFGLVLSVRSGLNSPEQYRERLAEVAAQASLPGRTWRSLSDTAVTAQILFNASQQWENWRRSVDFYTEGILIWLEVDALIRQKSHGSKSLDDFCRMFAGGTSGKAIVVSYNFDDVVSMLNSILSYDWKAFFVQRLFSLNPTPPLAGIEASGWKVTYTERRSELTMAKESFLQEVDLRYSIGGLIAKDGEFLDVVEGGALGKAGAAPGMKLLAVNTRKYTPEILRQALKVGKGNSTPLELIVSYDQYFLTLHVRYNGGERYPHLERDEKTPDGLSLIIRPLVSNE